jgi:hypothetical protein
MEQRLEHHMAERELKETLSEVSSRDKEELLEEIELLKRKEGRPKRGLREVQKAGNASRRWRNGRIWSSITSARCKMSAIKAGRHQRLKGTRGNAANAWLRSVNSSRHFETGSFEGRALGKSRKARIKLEGRRNGAVLIKIRCSRELKAEKEA